MYPSERTKELLSLAKATATAWCTSEVTTEQMMDAWVDYHSSNIADDIDNEILQELLKNEHKM